MKVECELAKQAGCNSRISTLSEGLSESHQRNEAEPEKSNYPTSSAQCSCKSLPVIQITLCQMQQRQGSTWREFENNSQEYRVIKDFAESTYTRCDIFRATALYHQTRDLLYVKEFLGHRSLINTLKYTHLVDWQTDEFICKAARTIEEASKLIETGFDFVTQIEDVKLFKKRK